MVAALLFFLLAPLPACAAPVVARVLELSRLASLEPEHTNLSRGQELHEGDRVTVMEKSRLRLLLSSGGVIELGEHSELLFKRDALGRSFLRLAHGSILFADKASRKLELRTGKLRIEFSGRGFYFLQEPERPAYFCSCDGKAALRWPGGSRELSGSAHGSPFRIDLAKSEPISPAEKLPGHEESRLLELRALLTKKLPPGGEKTAPPDSGRAR